MNLISTIVDDIFHALKRHETEATGLLSGSAGMLLFFHEYDLHHNTDESRVVFEEKLTTFIKCLSGNSSATYADGFAGIACVLHFLGRNRKLPFKLDVLYAQLDKVLSLSLRDAMERQDFDFLHGAIGIGCYFLERKNPEALRQLIQALRRHAVSDEHGTRWSSPLEMSKGKHESVFQLSLSHGSAAILVFLARAMETFPELQQEAQSLIDETIAYLHYVKLNNQPSVYPDYGFPDGSAHSPKSSRLAWCIGDLGINAALIRVAQSKGDDILLSQALNDLLLSAQRQTYEESGVIDASLCHGSAGIAQVYRHAAYDSGNAAFNTAAERWIHEMTMNYESGKPLESFRSWGGRDKGRQEDHSFITGIAGIGLTLLSQLQNHKPTWGQLILI